MNKFHCEKERWTDHYFAVLEHLFFIRLLKIIIILKSWRKTTHFKMKFHILHSYNLWTAVFAIFSCFIPVWTLVIWVIRLLYTFLSLLCNILSTGIWRSYLAQFGKNSLNFKNHSNSIQVAIFVFSHQLFSNSVGILQFSISILNSIKRRVRTRCYTESFSLRWSSFFWLLRWLIQILFKDDIERI